MDSINIITQYYKVKSSDTEYREKRQAEIDYCLLENSKNKYINKIHLLVEEKYDLCFIPTEYISIIEQVVINKRLTYKDAFTYYNQHLGNKICILINADIYLDNSIEILRHINFDNILIALNRYETNNNTLNGIMNNECLEKGCDYLTPFQPSVWSQDGWIWKTNNINIANADFNLGIIGCDNHIAYLFYTQGYKVINPSYLICINHHDNLSIKINEYGISKGNVSKLREDRIGEHNEYIFINNILDIPDKYTYYTICENITKSNNKTVAPILNHIFNKYVKKIYINQSQVIASSYFNEDVIPFYVDIDQKNYWRPQETDSQPYIEFIFENIYEIAYIDIKGKSVNKDDLYFAYVKKFKISYMDNNSNWNDINTIFEGINITNSNYIKRIYLDNTIECKKIRFYLLEKHNFYAFQVGMYYINYKKHDIFDYVSKVKELNYKYINTYFNYKTVIENNICDVTQSNNNKYIQNILNEYIEDGICLFICVMNRTKNIEDNIDSWISQNINQLIIIDWSSDNEFYNIIENKKDNRILYVRVNNEKTYCRTYTQNLAMSLCKYNKIIKIDSDIILYEKFFENHPLNPGEFYVGEWFCARNENEKFTHGNLYLWLSDFIRINGYNEYIKCYGWDDSDLTIRLMLCGLEKKLFNMDKLYHVPHDNSSRIVNLISKKDPNLLTRIHKYCLNEMNFWSQNNKRTTYNIIRESDTYIKCYRVVDDKLNVIDSKIYNYAYNKAIIEVFGWYRDHNNIEHTNAVNNLDYQFIETFLLNIK